jgi:hypothetical protein
VRDAGECPGAPPAFGLALSIDAVVLDALIPSIRMELASAIAEQAAAPCFPMRLYCLHGARAYRPISSGSRRSSSAAHSFRGRSVAYQQVLVREEGPPGFAFGC